MVDATTLRALLATVPSGFVAARTELAKQLRADGDRDGADAVKALRRLGVADWALDVAAGEDPELAGAFADAAADVLEAQEAAMAGRGGGDLRARLKTLRTRSAALVAAAAAVAERHDQRGAGSTSLDLAARLTEIGANRAAIELLRDGLIGAADPGSADPFGVVAGSSRESEPRSATARPAGLPAKAAKAAKAAKPSSGAGTQPNELERRRAERRARADAEQAAKSAASELAAAEAALAKSKAVAAKAAGRVAEAEERLAAAVEARDAADARFAAAEENHRRAADESERALAARSSQC